MITPLTEQETMDANTNANIGTLLVLQNQDMSVWHIRLGPGEQLPPHRHDRPYFWTVLTDGRGRSRMGDGGITDITYHVGDTAFFTGEKGFVHDLTNTGESELLFVTVEFNR